MLCPKCDTAAQIKTSKTIVTGDDNPETATEVCIVQQFVCRNQACSEYEKTIGEVRHKIY